MPDQRIHGFFEWYDQTKCYGVIHGDDGGSYFAPHTNHPSIAHAEKGQRVMFLIRKRFHNRPGLEAYDIQLEQASDVQLAAQEALRLKRERLEGRTEQPVEEFPPGTRLYHPYLGYGEVVLTTKNILSVRFDNNPNQAEDIKREYLVKASEKGVKGEEPTSPKVIKPVPKKESRTGAFRTGSTIADYIHQLAADVHEILTQEGIEENNIYRFEESSIPASPPRAIELDPRVAQAFHDTQNITDFYSHQILTRQALLEGKNVIISTPTASGKTEAYNPTILEELLNHPEATALYVFPLVALGFDQAERLDKLNHALPDASRLQIGIYNSNVAKEKKSEVLRANNRILITTPDSLHYIFLPKRYSNWQNFYRNLRYVVIDEAHVYKGVLGANMANIIRRLLVRCRREGNPQFPQLIISSATVRHPANLANQLTGLPADDFEVIVESGAPQPGRHFLVTRSDIHDLETICSELLDVTTVKVTNQEKQPVSTIVFLRSINEVKQSARGLREHLSRIGKHDYVHLVDEFYADKGDKNDILIRLREGKVRCLFTTTALMAGIDIGSLDVAIVKYFPGLVMDARQMFGRAGRAGEGAVIFIANRTDPFDQFYFERPEQLFKGPIEDVIANPENPILLAAHLKCAAQVENAQYNREGPLPGQWVGLFGQMGQDLLESLVSLKSLRIQGGSYHLNTDDPHDQEPLKNIRSIGSETYSLKNIADNQLLEEKREATAFRDAHPGAIVWVNGQNYAVVEFDKSAHEIKCQQQHNRDLRTQGLEESEIEIVSVDSNNNGKPAPTLMDGVTIQSGKVRISTRVDNFQLYKSHPVMQCRKRSCRYETPELKIQRCPKCGSPVRPKQVEEMVEVNPVPGTPGLCRTLETRASWINIPMTVKNRFSAEFWPRWLQASNNDLEPGKPVPNFEYAVHSMEHAVLKAFPEYIRCDRDEIGGLHELDLDGLAARLYIYDDFPGGLGLSDEFLYDHNNLFEGAINIIERCTCEDDQGCPVCLSYFRCNNFNQSLSKLAGRYLLYLIMNKNLRIVQEELEDYVNVSIPPSQVLQLPAGISGRITR